MKTSTSRPLFKDLSDDDLVAAYWDARASAASWDKFAPVVHSRRNRSKVAGGVLRALKDIDIIVAIARRRGVSLKRKEA